MQLFQRTLLCSWDIRIGDPLFYVGQKSTATGEVRSAFRSISSNSVETVKYRGRVVSTLLGLSQGNDVNTTSNFKFAEFNNFGGQAITVALQNSEAMFVLLWHISLAVNRGRLVGGPLHRCTEMASPCICSPQSLQSQLGFPGTLRMELLPACYADEKTSNFS